MGLPVFIALAGGGLGALAPARHGAACAVDLFAANGLASMLPRAPGTSALLVSIGFCAGLSLFSIVIHGASSIYDASREMTKPGDPALFFLCVIFSLVIGYSVTWLGPDAAAQPRRACGWTPWRHT